MASLNGKILKDVFVQVDVVDLKVPDISDGIALLVEGFWQSFGRLATLTVSKT